MPYSIETRPNGALISLSATSREEFVRDLVTSLLEAAYGKSPASAGAPERVVPIQAAGSDEAELLANLAADTLRAVGATAGTLLPPRWLAFDERRVTVTLPVAGGRHHGPVLAAGRATVERPLPDLRATLAVAAP